MKNNTIESLKKYISSDDEYFDSYNFDLLCEIIKTAIFIDLEQPLKLFNVSIEFVCDNPKEPMKSVDFIITEIEKANLNKEQQYFVISWIYQYVYQSEFDFDSTTITKLLECQKKKIKNEVETQNKISKTKTIRESLKDTIHKEFEKLPETLKELDPVQRLSIICKLMPFILSRAEFTTN